jgi:hypothetical protein
MLKRDMLYTVKALRRGTVLMGVKRALLEMAWGEKTMNLVPSVIPDPHFSIRADGGK